MDPLTIALILGGLGVAQGISQTNKQQKAADDQRKIEAVKAKWFGWNKDVPQNIQNPDMLSNVLGGALGGFTAGADIGNVFNLASQKPMDTSSRVVPTLQSQGIVPPKSYLGSIDQSSTYTPPGMPTLQMPPSILEGNKTPTNVTQTSWWKLLPLEDKQAILQGSK